MAKKTTNGVEFATFTVEGRREEFDCEYCGWPVISGDTAYRTENWTLFCCSEHIDLYEAFTGKT
jgi:hypothetical protein